MSIRRRWLRWRNQALAGWETLALARRIQRAAGALGCPANLALRSIGCGGDRAGGHILRILAEGLERLNDQGKALKEVR